MFQQIGCITNFIFHEKADWESARKFWSNVLEVDRKQIKVYFKRHNPLPKRKNIGRSYNGRDENYSECWSGPN